MSDSWERILAAVAEGGPLARQLALQQVASTVVLEADSLDEALPRLLRLICTTLGWRVGAAWLVEAPAGFLRCVAAWPEGPGRDASFVAVTRALTLARGTGLPGRVWESGEPTWITDVGRDPNFPRAAEAVRASLHTAIGFPVVVAGEPFGVLEFFSETLEPPDDALLRTMASVGALVAQFIVRTRALEALRDSETRKAAMLDAALDSVVCMDGEGLITEFNRAAEATFGYRRADVLGKRVSDLLVPAHLREAHRSGLRRYLATGEQHVLGRRVAMTALRADGSEFPVELAVVRMATPGVPQFTSFMRDLSDRARAERERARLLGELHAAVQARDEFLSTASHELRTPSTALLLQLQLLLRHQASGRLAPDEAGRRLEAAVEQARRLVRLVESLLDLSRVSSGRLELAPTTFDLAELVRGVGVQLADLARAAGCELRLHAPAPVVGTWDRARLEQVVTNLLSNALKYAPNAPIDVSVARLDERALVVVRDYGPGIADAVVASIFERFERAPGAAPGGLGLGLFLVRQLVEAHGGLIDVETSPGAGAAFHVTLPIGA